ncbi:MAG: hypothetical protein U0103_19710 [Candidatus Obscuribacterales bacterium]|jgi:hypothetical protein|nr:hypothetical protein [Cyanobacteria bacterium SZAS LIN-5]RTL43779.1 MAG: hypothetical protein EKK48_08525 [Candidatus Melainabacteria bacterium]
MIRALINGLAGACVLTVAHELVRKSQPEAPRLDILGMRGVSKVMTAFGLEPPSGSTLKKYALVTDIVSNTLMYSGVGAKPGFGAWFKGVNVGLMAGVGVVTMPEKVGLGKDAALLTKRTRSTAVTTVGLYILGGLAAAAVAQIGRKK